MCMQGKNRTEIQLSIAMKVDNRKSDKFDVYDVIKCYFSKFISLGSISYVNSWENFS